MSKGMELAHRPATALGQVAELEARLKDVQELANYWCEKWEDSQSALEAAERERDEATDACTVGETVLLQRLRDLTSRYERLRNLLQELEWEANVGQLSSGRCPKCRTVRGAFNKHSKGCELRAALDEEEKGENHEESNLQRRYERLREAADDMLHQYIDGYVESDEAARAAQKLQDVLHDDRAAPDEKGEWNEDTSTTD